MSKPRVRVQRLVAELVRGVAPRGRRASGGRARGGAAAANPIGLWPDGATRPDADWRVAGGSAALAEANNVHIVRLLAPSPRTP